ncbi:MAG: prolyl oligopeptidase family serine peptidase, partial [Gemmataceae bacterium]|nr:prolyl oligopeptidase family serine peptidase [Gemmataceae bacterium]
MRSLLLAACLASPVLAAPKVQRKTYDFKEAKKEMEYALVVPSRYDKARKWPLVVCLHGLGGTPRQILGYPGFASLADKHGYLLAAPMGYNTRGWYGARPLLRSDGAPDNLQELSEKDVMNVLDLVQKEHSVDPDRVYLMGHSMGGGGTWHLGVKHPDKWAALAPIAPATRLPVSSLEKIKHVPVFLVQGDKDRLVPVAGARRWAAQMKKLGMTHEYVEVEGGDHVRPAFSSLPKMFAFFDKHKRMPGRGRSGVPAGPRARQAGKPER